MAIDTVQLLNRLASGGNLAGLGAGVGTGGVGGASGVAGAARSTSVAQASFAELLSQARDGTISTNAPVSIDPGVEASFNDDQMARLSLGADKAEAAGLRTALVLMDGQRLVMDVHSRRITGVAETKGGVVTGVDGVLDLGNAGTAGAAGGPTSGAPAAAEAAPGGQAASALTPPGVLPGQNLSLARLLQTLGRG